MGKVYLKENNTNKLWLLKINEIKDQKSPKFLYWIDDENLLVIIGHGYGTVSKGGNLYCINVKMILLLQYTKQKIINMK
ncbi:DUF4652 domain-containing protein [Clostridium botulinum]|nr:DUF4652 domain-containing protein [Clostridium botulinum]